jgi:iron uptake system EfeUOB component EfeO/EfeM
MALRRAVELCSGMDALADALSVDADSLKKWISGDEEVPQEVFVQAVGLLLEAMATRSRRRTPDSNDGGRKENRH